VSETKTLPRSIFTAENRAKLLALAVGAPTGVVLEIGGQTVNLVALSTAQGREVLAMVRKVGALYERISSKTASNIEIFEALGEDGPHALEIVKDVLRKSFFVDPEDVNEPHARAAQLEIFEEWFEAIPIGEILTKAVPAILGANGVTNLTDRPTIASPTDETTSSQPTGIPSTPLGSS
jgi:hypothetical protein